MASPSLPDTSTKIAKETSEIRGKKALAFLVTMLLAMPVEIAAIAHSDPHANPTDASQHVFGAVASISIAAWALSKMIPDGWLDLKRTILLAVILSGGLTMYMLH